MPDVSELRELARAYWNGEKVECPTHRGAVMRGSYIQTTYADHIYLECPRGKETITIPQRPRQQEFNAEQVEGLVLNLQRGDNVLCFRCQSRLVSESDEAPARPPTRYTWTCVRCLSWGTWQVGDREPSAAAATS